MKYSQWIWMKDPTNQQAIHNIPVDKYSSPIPPHRVTRNCPCEPEEKLGESGMIVFQHKAVEGFGYD